MNEQIISLRKYLKKHLPAVRFEHTLSVSYTCMNLAMRYGYSIDKAELAGLLHDCAKQYSIDQLFDQCKKNGIILTEDEKLSPAVIHAGYGAWMAKEKFHIFDDEVLNAISCHTTGKPNMTQLDQILFVSDYIEPRRYKAEQLAEIRRIAFLDLEYSLFLILESTLRYLERRGTPIHPMTRVAYEFYYADHHNKKGI